MQVAFCQTLSPDERLTLFARRKAELARRLAERSRATDGRTDTYRRSLREHDTQTLTHDLTWIDELIAATRAEADDTSEPLPHLTGGTTP